VNFNWKTWTGVAVTVLVIGFVAARWRSSFVQRPPDWLRQQDKHSVRLPAASLKHFREFYRQIEIEAEQKNLPVGSIQFLELAADGKEMIAWNTERLANQGFNPAANFDQWGGSEETRLLGYYTLEGDPVNFTVKHHPARPQDFFPVIHLLKPLAPGASALVLRLDRRPLTLKPNAKGQTQFGLGRLIKPANAIHARGVCLPDHAQLVQYKPEKGAFEFPDNPPMVGWINSCLDPSLPPLSATFTLAH